MNRTHLPLLVGVLLVAVFGTAQAVLRTSEEPAALEIVDWTPYANLGEAPWDSPVLLEFSADWCVPCRRLQVTVFRDPAFVQTLERLDLRPIRIEFDSRQALQWQRISSRYGVGGYPAMVVIAPDGRHASAIEGVATVAEYADQFEKALARLNNQLFFHDPGATPPPDRARLTLRQFNTWWYLPRENRTDWRSNPTSDFSTWVNDHIDLISDEFTNFPPAYDYYTDHGIRTVPTLVLEDWRGVELLRFEGLTQIEAAPDAIARIAREHGLDVPDPPKPHTPLEK